MTLREHEPRRPPWPHAFETRGEAVIGIRILRRVMLLVLLLTAIGLNACGGDGEEEAAAVSTSTPVPEATPPPATPVQPTETATVAALPTETASPTATLELAPTATPSILAEPVVNEGRLTVHGDMNVREGPGTEYEIVGGARLGQEFPITGKNAAGDWWQIDLGGQIGWIFAPFVTAVDAENVPVVDGGEMAMMEKKALVTINGDMNVRAGPGTNYAIVGPATYGQEYAVTGKSEDGEWWRIDYDDQSGWIFAPFVEAANTEGVAVVDSGEIAAQENAVVTVNGDMNVRAGPGTEYDNVGAATIGQEFPITGKNAAGDWWEINYNGQTAWIYAPFVTATNADNVPVVGVGEMAGTDGAVLAVHGDMNVRAGPDTESARIGGATEGEQYQVTGKDGTGNWWRIDYDGQTGWIYAPFVTVTGGENVPVVSEESAAPAEPEQEAAPVETPGEQAVIFNIVDGDTVDVRYANGIEERIHLLDADAPEFDDVVECFGAQASLFANLFNSATVSVESGGRDELGRLLAYIWLEDGRLFNEVLTREGYARFNASGNPGIYAARIQAASELAKSEGSGLWSQCPVEAVPTPTPAG